MSERRQVHSDLMGAAGLRDRSDNAEAFRAATESALHHKFRARRSAQRMNRLLEPDRGRRMNSLASERGVDRLAIPLGPAPDDRKILLGNTLLLHQQAKTPRRRPVFRYKDQPTRFAIESIDDRNLSTIRNLEREQLFQFSPESARAARFSGMNEQKGRLFDDNEIIALRDDRKVMRVICARCVRGG